MEKMKKVVTGLDEVEEERNVAWILQQARVHHLLQGNLFGSGGRERLVKLVKAVGVDKSSRTDYQCQQVGLKTVQQSGGAATLLLLLTGMDDVNLAGMICKRYRLSVKQYG